MVSAIGEEIRNMPYKNTKTPIDAWGEYLCPVPPAADAQKNPGKGFEIC
jgi:hypothetical protein